MVKCPIKGDVGILFPRVSYSILPYNLFFNPIRIQMTSYKYTKHD